MGKRKNRTAPFLLFCINFVKSKSCSLVMKKFKCLFFLICISLIVCIPVVEGGDSVMDKHFASLAYSLVKDTLDFLPVRWARKVVPDGQPSTIVNFIAECDFSKLQINDSIESRNFAAHVGYIIIKIYGKPPLENIQIPQTVYYDGFNAVDNLEKKISESMPVILKSEYGYRDKYNLALNLMLNMWIDYFIMAGYEMKNMPVEGVYVRDSYNKLYLYEAAENENPS